MTANLPKLLVSSCLAALPLVACAPREQVDAKPAPSMNAATISVAQRISLDGATGVPNAAELAGAAQPVLNNTPEALAVRAADEVRLPDGTVGVRVDKRYYHTIVVCRQADGSFTTDCPAAGAGGKR